MNDVSRRGFLFGAIAVPAGIVLPAALAAELSLPPPESEVGQSLIIRRSGAVLDIRDLHSRSSKITLVDGGKVLGVFHVVEVSHDISRGMMGDGRGYMSGLDSHRITLELQGFM